MRANCWKRQRLELNDRTYLLLWRGRGVLLRILGGWRVCRPVLQILTRFQTKNVIFHTRFQTNKTLKPIPVFRPVVQTLESALHRINHFTIQRISIRETNCAIHWIDFFYPVDSAIQRLNNRGQAYSQKFNVITWAPGYHYLD